VAVQQLLELDFHAHLPAEEDRTAGRHMKTVISPPTRQDCTHHTTNLRGRTVCLCSLQVVEVGSFSTHIIPTRASSKVDQYGWIF